MKIKTTWNATNAPAADGAGRIGPRGTGCASAGFRGAIPELARAPTPCIRASGAPFVIHATKTR